MEIRKWKSRDTDVFCARNILSETESANLALFAIAEALTACSNPDCDRDAPPIWTKIRMTQAAGWSESKWSVSLELLHVLNCNWNQVYSNHLHMKDFEVRPARPGSDRITAHKVTTFFNEKYKRFRVRENPSLAVLLR